MQSIVDLSKHLTTMYMLLDKLFLLICNIAHFINIMINLSNLNNLIYSCKFEMMSN